MLDSSYRFAFDVNQYDAYMDRADWDIQAKTFNVKNHEEGGSIVMVSLNKRRTPFILTRLRANSAC